MSTIKLPTAHVRTLTMWLREYVVRVRRSQSRSRAVSGAKPDRRDDMRAEQLFAQAVQENSNLELDWLWCAANMSRVDQQRYCLRRALEINPDSDLAKRALAELPQEVPVEAVALTVRTSP